MTRRWKNGYYFPSISHNCNMLFLLLYSIICIYQEGSLRISRIISKDHYYNLLLKDKFVNYRHWSNDIRIESQSCLQLAFPFEDLNLHWTIKSAFTLQALTNSLYQVSLSF